MDRDNFMAADAAVKYGLVDRVVENRKAVKMPGGNSDSPTARKNNE
jgi:hypothetical protein